MSKCSPNGLDTGTISLAKANGNIGVGKYGNKGKGSTYGADGTVESDVWTQSDIKNSEDDFHFCIMDNPSDVVMDSTTLDNLRIPRTL